MIRHAIPLLLVTAVCLAAGPTPAPIRSKSTSESDPRIESRADPLLSASVEAAAGVAGVAAAVRGSTVSLPGRGEYAAAAVGVPAALSLARTYLPTQAEFNALAATDPIALLDACRRRTDQLKGYRALLHKQERIRGRLHQPELIRTSVRAHPFAVLMIWEKGAREVLGTATEGVLFVAGENNGKIRVWRPTARFLPKFLDISPTEDQAKASSRYAITEGGLLHASERTYRAWIEAREKGRLTWHYEGTRPVPEVGGRVCHVITRISEPPVVDPFLMGESPTDGRARPADATRTVTIMIDVETWLQVGSRITNPAGELVGEYYFRDVELNPAFPPDQFKPSVFRK